MLRKGRKEMDYEMDREGDNERQRPGGQRELFGVIARGDGGGFDVRYTLYKSQHVISFVQLLLCFRVGDLPDY